MDRFRPDDPVWKEGAGYAGPGIVKATFKAWDGSLRYVVEHRLAGGRGFFYHIYSNRELKSDGREHVEAGADQIDPRPGRSGPSV